MARPFLRGIKRQPVTVMLRPKVVALIKQAAKKAEMPVSQFIATLVDDHFMSEAREKVG